MNRDIFKSRRSRLACGITAASVAVAGAGAAFAVHEVKEARLNDYEIEAFADAKRLATLDLDLAAAAERADKVLADTEGKVKDNAVREALAAQIAKARELTKDTADHTPTRPEFSSDEQAEATIDAQDLQIGKLLATSGRLAAAQKAVEDAHNVWVLETALAAYDGAMAGATAARDTGQGVLGGSDGKVMDNATREALASVLAALQAQMDVKVDRTEPKALNDASAKLTGATESVTGATTTVQESQAAWEAEQARLAAEAEARAKAEAEARAKAEADAAAARRAAEAKKASGSKSSSGGGSSKSGGGSSSKSSGGSGSSSKSGGGGSSGGSGSSSKSGGGGSTGGSGGGGSNGGGKPGPSVTGPKSPPSVGSKGGNGKLGT